MPTESNEPRYCVGREREIAYVQTLLHEAALGTGAAVVFNGTPGCGKSRLLGECAKIKSPALAISAHCSPASAFGQGLHVQLSEHLNAGGAPATCEPRALLGAALPEVLRHKPIVAFVDDVHLASDGDLDVLDALVFLARRQRFVLVACAGGEPLSRSAWTPRRKQQWLSQGAQHRSLELLDDGAMELLIRNLLRDGDAIDDETFREIVRTAQGNPRYAVELTRRAGRSRHANDLVPESAYAKVDNARRSLSKPGFEMLALCSVIADRFHERWIAEIAHRPARAIASALQEACDCGILGEDANAPGWFFFRERAVRKAAYVTMVSPKRRLLHEAVVENLSDTAGESDRIRLLAHHWDALERHERAASLLHRAGDELARAGDYAAAADSYERAMVHLPTGSPAWLAAGVALVDCANRPGDHARVIAAVERIRTSTDLQREPATAANLLLVLFFAYLASGLRDEARAIIDEVAALDVPNARDLADKGRLALAYCLGYSGGSAAAAELLGGVDLGTSASDEVRWRYLVASAVVDAPTHAPVSVLRTIDRAIDLGARVSLAAEAITLDDAAAISLRYGDLDSAMSYIDRAEQVAARGGDYLERVRRETVTTRARLNLVSGDLATARALLLSNLEWRGSGKYIEAVHAAIGVYVGMRTGDAALVDALYDPQLLIAAAAARDVELCGTLLPGFAEAMQVRGAPGQLQQALRDCVATRVVDTCARIQLCAARYGSAEAVDEAAEQMKRYVRTTQAPIAAAHDALFTAIVARRSGKLNLARDRAREAAALYARFGWRLSQALALEFADEPKDAIAAYAACGANADVARVTAGQTRKLKRSPFGARLTARERQVARLLARKRSDKEIAQALEISVRTVHHHVEAILSKLGVRERAQVRESAIDAS